MPITRRDYFKPIQLGGCVLWLDGADSSTITGTSPVTQWRDKSVNGYVFTGTGAVISNSGLFFNGSSYLVNGLLTAIPAPYTVFAVGSSTSQPNTFQRMISGGVKVGGDGPYDAILAVGTSNTTPFVWFGYSSGWLANPYLTGASYSGTNLFMTSGTVSSGTSPTLFGYANGNQLSSNVGAAFQATSLTGLNIGGGYSSTTNGLQPWYGNINEIIIVSNVLTSQRQQVEAYLAQKWSLTGSLPAGHPGLTSVLYRPVTNTLTKSVYYTQFSPKTIQNCQLWLDAADLTSMTITSGSISQWNDKSGNGYSFVNNATFTPWNFGSIYYPTITYSGLNKQNIVSFNTQSLGSVDIFPSGNAQNFSMFLVGTSYMGRGEDGYGSGWSISFPDFLGSIVFVGSGAVGYTMTNGTGLLNYLEVTQGSTSVITTYNSGSLVQTQSPVNNTLRSSTIGFQIGRRSGYYRNGYIAEILVYSRVLSSGERQTVESYLAQKWGLTAALPAGNINNTFPAGSPVALQTYIPKVQTNVGYTLFFPGIPTITTPTNTGNITTLTMTWTAPAVTGTAGQVSGYIVYIVASGSPVATQTLGNVLTTSFSPMTTNLNYSYSVAATGPGGTGVTSSSSLTTAYYATPGAPTVGTAANTGNLSTLTMTWTAGSGTTTYYKVYVVVGGSTVATLTPGNVLTTTYSMTTNLEYSFYVTATNTIAGATSESSATTGNAVYYATPAAPTVGTATNTGNSTTLTMTWTAGSGTTTYYTVYVVVGGSTVATLTPGNVLTTTYSMTTNLSYTFYVTGTNTIAGATSGTSATSGSAIYYATPDAPTVNTPTNTLDTLNMSWNAPAQTVTSYTVYVRAASSLVATLTPGLVTSTTYSPMTQSVAYSFYVTATNGTVTSGLSTTSAAVTYTPALVLPSQPYWLAGGTANPNNAVLAFSGNRGINWTNIPLGFTGTVYCVAYNGSNLFVMGGTFSSCLYTSSNGIDWTANGQTLLTGIYSVVYAANISTWVAVGNGASNTIIYSTNGTTWNGAGSIMTTQVLGVAYNGTNLFVAIGYGGSFRLATSVNGISWTGRTTSAFPTYGYGISYSSNGTWLATGTGNPNVAYSTDGTTWTSTVHIASMTNGYGTAFLSNTYLVCGTAGGVFTSANLTSWTQTVPGITAFAISANSNTAICASAGSTTTFSRSENGTTWSSVPLSSASMFTNSVQGLCHVP